MSTIEAATDCMSGCHVRRLSFFLVSGFFEAPVRMVRQGIPNYLAKGSDVYLSKLEQSDLVKMGHLQPDGWPDIQPEFQFYVAQPFCHPVKVEMENKIVGLGCLIRFEKTAWLAHVIVDKHNRKRGIGHEIVAHLLSLDGTIQTYSLIATPLGEQLYKQFGFEVISDYLHYKRPQPFITAPPFQLQSKKIKPFHSRFHQEIIALDKMITGENRETLLATQLDSSLLFKGNTNAVTGVYLPDAREGAVYATKPEAGKALLKLKVAHKNDVVLPHQNPIGRQFLEELGFQLIRVQGKRMILGDALPWMPEAIYSRMGGNFG